MEVLEFRKIRVSDRFEKRFDAWSRIYEYPMVLDMIEKYKPNKDISIHNSSWGHKGCHVTFKNTLEKKYKNVINTDISPSRYPNTGIWNITKENKSFEEKFDVVLNVSTIEEVNFDHVTIFNNLLKQVKPNGLVICTFDIPGIQLDKISFHIDKEIERFDDELNGSNSAVPVQKYRSLTCGVYY